MVDRRGISGVPLGIVVSMLNRVLFENLPREVVLVEEIHGGRYIPKLIRKSCSNRSTFRPAGKRY